MKCNNCPLFSRHESENESYELCGLFGDSWDDDFQYEDKEMGMIVGCYIDRHYIEKVSKLQTEGTVSRNDKG